MVHNYNIHGVLFQSCVPIPQLKFFQQRKIKQFDLILTPIESAWGKPYYQITERFPFDVQITINKDVDKIIMGISSILMNSPSILYGTIIKPMLFILQLKRNRTFIHSSCISLNNSAIIISAPANTGKSLTSLMSLRYNPKYEYLSDDSTLIDDEGNCYSFPETVSICPVIINFSNFNTQKRLMFNLKSFIFSPKWEHVREFMLKTSIPTISRNIIFNRLMMDEYTGVEADDILGVKVKIPEKAKAKIICFLKDGSKNEIRKIPKKEALKRLYVLNPRAPENFFSEETLHAMSCVANNGRRELFLKEHQIVSKFLDSTDCFELERTDKNWYLDLEHLL